MAIKILPGTPMDMPKQVRVPGKPLDPNEVTMIGNLEEEIPPPPKVNTFRNFLPIRMFANFPQMNLGCASQEK